jgi:S-adenosyl-L-methionine hydrolase (adenosine-forming)
VSASFPSPISAIPPIALLTDFGVADGYPGVMKGVILGIAPNAPLVDLTHEIPPQDVRSAAWVLHTAWRYFPERTVFLCVVDPGVGSDRRPIALHAANHYFVGPDNGLFSYVLAEASASRAVMLANPRYLPERRSATFHGRDVFAPAAAWLAAGVALEELGSGLALESLVRFPLSEPQWQGTSLVAHCTHIDHFGNILTDVTGPLAETVFAAPAITLTLAGQPITARAGTFAKGPEGALFLYLDSSGYLAVARRNGSALAALGIPAARLYDAPFTISGVEHDAP